MTGKKRPNKWIGIMFSCCNIYGRAYFDPEKNQYLARCPKCGKQAWFIVGPGGTDDRFFEVE